MIPIATSPEPKGTWSVRAIGVISFAHGAGDFFSGIVPLLIFYLVIKQWHLSPLHQGIAGFGWYLTSSIVQPFFGWYADGRGRWWFLPTGVLLTVASVGLIGLSPNYWTLMFLVTFGGIGSAVMHPEAGKYAAQVGSRHHASAISFFQVGGQVGYALGPIVIAALLVQLGGRASVVIALPGLVAVTALFWAMPKVHAHADKGGHSGARDRTEFSNGSIVDIVLLVCSTGLRHLTSAAFITYLPNVLTGRGATLAVAGQVVTAFLMVGTIGLLAGGVLGDRLGHRFVSVSSLALCTPMLVGFFMLPTPWNLASLLLGSVMLSVQNAPAVALTQALMPRNLGMALGLINGVAFGFGSAAVALLGWQVERIGAGPTLTRVAWVPILAVVCFAMVGRRRPAHMR